MGVHGAKAVEFKNKKAEANQFAKIVPTEQKKNKEGEGMSCLMKICE